MGDAWRMAIGTLTTVRVAAPRQITSGTAAAAMLLAPVAGLLLGTIAAVVTWAALGLGTGPMVAAVLAVAALRLGDRAFHLDGLADTVDGLAASYDRERALSVMRTGDTGPAGAAALVLVLLVQVAAIARLSEIAAGDSWTAPGHVVAGVAVAGCVVVSRAMLAVCCVRGVPAARAEGLGAVVAGVVRVPAMVALLVGVTAALAGALALTTMLGESAAVPWWAALTAVATAVLVTTVVVSRCVRRLGGVTGDVLGAVVEVSLAAGLVALVAASG